MCSNINSHHNIKNAVQNMNSYVKKKYPINFQVRNSSSTYTFETFRRFKTADIETHERIEPFAFHSMHDLLLR